MVKYYYKNLRSNKLEKLKKFKVGSWVHVENPDAEDVERLVKEFSLDEGLVKDGIDLYEVPRLEVEDKIIYIYTRFAFSEDDRIQTMPILFIIGETFLLTLSAKSVSPFNKFITGHMDICTTQKTKLLLQMLANINNDYNVYLHTISRKTRSAIIQIERITNKDIAQFVVYETILNDFLSALVPTNVIFNSLLSSKHLKLYEDDKELVEDLSLNNNQLIELSRSNLKTIVNIREAYSTIMTNNLNRVIKLFTSLTVILAVPTMIASIYGMNITLPFADSPLAFTGIIVSLIFISVSLIIVFIKNNWL